MGTFFYGLVFVTVVAVLVRERTMIATTVALFINWGLNTTVAAYYIANGDAYPYPFHWYMLIDYLTGLAIVLFIPLSFSRHPNKWQIAVTLIYAAQLTWHVGYMWSDQGAAEKYSSWYFLSWSAWAQLIIIGAWCVNFVCSHVLDALRNVSSDKALRSVDQCSGTGESQ